ncbi:hypothetical protein FB565_002556 [Actinoplanes lutulentus]|uniref:Uncharacterized protein n=1 Tax=Actinoplanes lutulentus TaxID=1287878 RepID=A0A327ZE44_9ACTN|nr:hypothetical protein [Actinoplanes lutulentus]MBB2942843.1 hypothetical protein [Actinoplanes lutulentus]RAK38422.1 hypothetical protein B0I29_105370 [Actinoplanes lutulentus]
MSSEPLVTTSVADATESTERGLLIAVLLLVLAGTAAILMTMP